MWDWDLVADLWCRSHEYFCRFMDLPKTVYTLYPDCLAQEEYTFIHGKTCNYECNHNPWISDNVAQNNIMAGQDPWMPGDSNFHANYLNRTLYDPVTGLHQTAMNVGTVQCICESLPVRVF